MGKRTEPKKLAVKRETLRKLDARALQQAVGGARPPTVTYTCVAE